MAGTAAISSSFVIEYLPTSTAATVITNPGRAFRVVGVSGNNTTAGALTVTLTDGTNNITSGGAQSVAANSSAFVELDMTNAEITLAEDLSVTASAVGLSPIYIHCVATGGGEALKAT
jgi:hypothetical protein